jgi:hypothetical protein
MLLGLVRWVWTRQINARRARDEAIDLAQGSLPSGQLILRRGVGVKKHAPTFSSAAALKFARN